MPLTFAAPDDAALPLHVLEPDAVEGWAAGGGFALALACPTVVASREARFIAGFTKIALMPDMGLLSTLPARIGPARASTPTPRSGSWRWRPNWLPRTGMWSDAATPT